MGARGVLGRGDAPVVWWALEGAPLLEHVEVVKLRKTPSLVFVGIFSSCDGGLEWQRGWFCFESVPLGKQGYRLRLTKVRFGGRQTTAKISASTRSFSQNTWGHRADTPKVYLMFRLGQILLYCIQHSRDQSPFSRSCSLEKASTTRKRSHGRPPGLEGDPRRLMDWTEVFCEEPQKSG